MAAPSQALGHFRIVAKLGEGGMGEVWRATDTRLNREVAIKVLPAAFADDPMRMGRFAREAQVLASLNHPGIAAIYGVEERALVMELVEGPTLAERIARGKIPLDEALPIAAQIAEALEYAHERGVVHRDLKPANIKITPEGRVKILDFGLAKAMSTDSGVSASADAATLSSPATMAGTILGTAAYMAPEQARGQNVDRRADIWAFGVVLYEMLTGERPFGGATISDTLAAVLRGEPDWTRVPPAVRRLLGGCLEKDPALRLHDLGDRRLLLGAAPSTARVDRAWLPWALTAAAAICAIVIGAAWFQRRLPLPHVVKVSTSMRNMFAVSRIALSHDGRYFAYLASSQSQLALAVRSMETGAVQTYPEIRNPRAMAWSPDDRFLLVHVLGGRLIRLELSSGAVTEFGTLATTMDTLAWMPGGTILDGALQQGILKIEPGGREESVIQPVQGNWYEDPVPVDADHFLYCMRVAGSPIQVILASLDGKTRIPLPLGPDGLVEYGGGYVFYPQNGTLLARALSTTGKLGEPSVLATGVTPIYLAATGVEFVVSQEGTVVYHTGEAAEELELFGRDGKGVALPQPGSHMLNNPRFSPNGSLIAYDAVAGADRDVWVYNLALQQATRFTLGGINSDPVWSPDGTELAFTRSNAVSWDIVARPSNGSREERLIATGPLPKYGREWTSGGQLVFDEMGASGYSIWKTSAGGGVPVEYIPSAGFNNTRAHVSPDGKWLAYNSDQSGTVQVYLETFPVRSGKWQISTGGGEEPRWSGDGQSLYFLSLDNKLMQAQLGFAAGGPVVSHSGELFAVPPAKDVAGNPLDVTRDGSRFVLNAELPGAADSWTVLLNWQAAMGGKK